MIVDTSALIAILLNEPECDEALALLQDAETALISTATVSETIIVAANKLGSDGPAQVMTLLELVNVEQVPLTAEHTQIIYDNIGKYGKGQGNKAQLNMGDFYAYALAKQAHQPLLCKGDDFPQTDIEYPARKILRIP